MKFTILIIEVLSMEVCWNQAFIDMCPAYEHSYFTLINILSELDVIKIHRCTCDVLFYMYSSIFTKVHF